jgi:PIN like domain
MFPRALREHGLKVETLVHTFQEYDVKDRDWLPRIGRLGWVVLTADYRMRYRERERDAIMENGVRVFILRGHLHTQKISYFLGNLQNIERILRTQDEAFMARVYRDRVEMWLTCTEWKAKVGLDDPEIEDDPEEPALL